MNDFIHHLRTWCEQKIALWQQTCGVTFKEGDVWWCRVGVNVGEEIYGKGLSYTRPILVLRKFTTNSFLGIPMTGQKRDGSWYVEITLHKKKSWLLLNQIRVLDRKRLTVRIGAIEPERLKNIKQRFIEFYSS